MIESEKDYNKFIEETEVNDLIISVIPSDDRCFHTATSKPTAVLVRDLETDKTYSISLGHPDCNFVPSKEKLIKNFQQRYQVWAFDKKSTFQLLPIDNLHDIDLWSHLEDAWTIDVNNYETAAHKLIRRNNHRQRNINDFVPLLKHQEMFDNMCDEVRTRYAFPVERNGGFIKENKWTLETLARLESTGIHINPECFRNHFDATIYDGDLVYSQYNIYTSTGRPSNRFDNVNYAALNKNDGARKCFTSRFGENGKMVLMDYSAFHPRIISHITKFPIDINTDIYEYLGEAYFGRKVTEYDMDEIKSITMRQFYGEIEKRFEHIKYLAHAKEFKEKYWKDFQENGFIKTPLFKRAITNKHLLDPNINKLFNYILQATETEIAVSMLMLVIDYLKSFKTKAVLYTYDSILFDFYKDESGEVLPKIIQIMKLENHFPIKIYEGDSYDSLTQITI